MKRGKKGAGHLEMITAFVLFFTFVVFLLIYIKPYKIGTLQGSVVAGLHDSFEEQTETELVRFFLQSYDPAEGTPDPCVKNSLDQSWFQYDLTNSLVKGVNGLEKDSFFDEALSELQIGSIDRYYYVMVSSVFDESDVIVGCDLMLPELGDIDEKKIISHKKLMKMHDAYYGIEGSYADLKEEMNFPEAYDFSIVSDLITMEGVVPEEGDIVAEDFIEEVLFSEDGRIINERFTLKVW
ncbi:hypothetical protein CMI37_10300 [Candidatus Pacearchaeota archaeon]|nr:hypothetical protein [Candidatus Pacearchaeota archaeon]